MDIFVPNNDQVITVVGMDDIVIVPEPSIVTINNTGSNLYFEHIQNTASTTWLVNHNLGARTNVSVKTLGGAEVVAEVLHNSVNQTTIYFDAATTGIATFS